MIFSPSNHLPISLFNITKAKMWFDTEKQVLSFTKEPIKNTWIWYSVKSRRDNYFLSMTFIIRGFALVIVRDLTVVIVYLVIRGFTGLK